MLNINSYIEDNYNNLPVCSKFFFTPISVIEILVNNLFPENLSLKWLLNVINDFFSCSLLKLCFLSQVNELQISNVKVSYNFRIGPTLWRSTASSIYDELS